jgi:hypothetical protein
MMSYGILYANLWTGNIFRQFEIHTHFDDSIYFPSFHSVKSGDSFIYGSLFVYKNILLYLVRDIQINQTNP